MNQIRPARADIGTENVRPVAFVMHATGDGRAWIGKLADIAKEINCRPADRRQKDLQIGPGHQLRKHSGSLLKQGAAQRILARAKTLRDTGQIPDWINRDLDDGNAAVLVHDATVIIRRRAASALCISGRSSRARVTAMVGRMSMPSAISALKFSATKCPHGSSETIRFGSLHCAKGPMLAAG